MRFNGGMFHDHAESPLFSETAPIGLYVFGEPSPHAPIWLLGNTQDEFATVRQQVAAGSLVVGVLDTGGLSLRDTVIEGGWTMDEVEAALDQLDPQRLSSRYALLPYAIWQLLGEADRFTKQGWAIVAGPIDVRWLVL